MSLYYPILLNLDSQKCLIVGGGQVASRKAASVLEVGAVVKLVSPKITGPLKDLAKEGKIEWVRDVFSPPHMDGACLVIASTDDETVNREIYEEARKRGIPVNVVDQPELCTFIVPSVIRRGDLVIAVSTSGKSPAVSKRVRKILEKEFGPAWGTYLEMMGAARRHTLKNIDDQKRREEIFTRLAGSDLLELIQQGDLQGARNLVEEIAEL